MNIINEDNLNTIFNIDSEEIKKEEETQSLVVSEQTTEMAETEPKNELELIKKNQFELIEKTKTLLDASIEFSLMSQHPQTIAATAALINSITNASELISKIELKNEELKLKKKEIETKSKKQEANTINNNAIFIGSTSELQKELINNLLQKIEKDQ